MTKEIEKASKTINWRERLAKLREVAVQLAGGGAIVAALVELHQLVSGGSPEAISAAGITAAAAIGTNIIAQGIMEFRRNPQHTEVVTRLEELHKHLESIKEKVEQNPMSAPECALEMQTALAWITQVKVEGDGNVVVLPDAQTGDLMTGGRRADHGGIYQEINNNYGAPPAPAPSRRPLCTVPPPSAQFVGRTHELDLIEQALSGGQIGAVCAVHGLGGVGKSALAFEYAHTHGARYPGGRFLLSCTGVTDLRVAVMGLAPLLGLKLPAELQADPAQGCACLFAELATAGAALLVFDNAESEALANTVALNGLRGHAESAHLLITTREDAGRCGEICAAIPLDVLPEDDAVALLRAYRPFAIGDEEHARAIVRRLGCWTLAVDIVGAYLKAAREVSYADALAWLREEGINAVRAAGEEAGGILRDEVNLTRLLKPTLERLSPAERLALEYASLCPPDAVALPWLLALAGRDHPNLLTEPKRGRPHPWSRALDLLVGLRLLSRTDEPNVAHMHQMVGEAIAAGMADADRAACREVLNAHVLERAKFLWEGWVEHANRWEIEPARAYAMLLLEDGNTAGVDIANWIQEPLGQLGLYQQQCDLLRHSLRKQETAGLDDPEMATTCSNLALVERDLGNLAAARELLQRAITIDEKAFAPDHPKLAIRYSNLATVEKALGNLAAARELLKRAIAIDEKAFAPDHPKLAIRYSNLATVEQALGNLAAARELLQRAIALEEKAYAPDHPNLAVSYSNLALVEKDLGNLAAARELLQRAIAIEEKAYAPDHPNLAVSYSNLALVEQDLGNLAVARELLQRAIAIDEKAFAPDHPKLAIRYSNLAMVEQDLGNLAAARELLQRAITIGEKAYAPDHPTLAGIYSNLSTVEQALGNLAAARELLQRAIAIWEKAYAPDHPTLAIRYNNMAYIEQDLGNQKAACELMRRAYSIRLKRLGAEHSYTRASRAWLEEYDTDFPR